MTDARIWATIAALAIGSYLIRLSFLGLIGSRRLPGWVAAPLRYTAVAVLPALIAPAVAFPAATGGQTDPARLGAALVTLLAGVALRSTLAGVGAGAVALVAGIWFWG